jgi:hypothetical protein
MNSIVRSDGQDLPGLIEKLVPSGTVLSDDVVGALKDTAGHPIVSRVCHATSTEPSSGVGGGRNIEVSLSGTMSSA